MATWDFLQPWLDVLSPSMMILPQSGWQPDCDGAESLALRLTRLIVDAFPNYQQKGDDAPPPRALGRAIEIVAMALRVDPQVWTMLRGRNRFDTGDHSVEIPLYDGFGRELFPAQNFAVAWELKMAMCNRKTLTEDDLSWLTNSFREDEEHGSDDDSVTVSAAAYREALAQIRHLNAFRANLDDPIAITITLSVDAVSTSLVSDAISAVVSGSRARFRFTGLRFGLYEYGPGPWVSDLFQQAHGTGIPIEGVYMIASVPPTGVSDVLTAVETSPVPNVDVFVGWDDEMPVLLKRLCDLRTRKLGVNIAYISPDMMQQIHQAVRRAEEAIDARESSAGLHWDAADRADSDVERLELTFGLPCNMTEDLNFDGHFNDPLGLAAQLWGRRSTCRLKHPALIHRLQETNTQAERVTTATQFDCILGNDATTAFLVIPSTKELLRADASDVEITTSTPCRLPLPTWLAKVRSLRVDHAGYMRFLGLPPLLYLFPSLVSLNLAPWLPTWEGILAPILLSLPSSLQYLQLRGSADSPSHLRALFQAYNENGLRVRSLQIEFENSQSLLTLLTEMADPQSTMASLLEELVMKLECSSLGEDEAEPVARAIERTLAANERLHYFHIFGRFPQEAQDLWRAKATPFHGTDMPRSIGSRLPRVCTLALVSVVCHYEYAADTSVLSNIVAFANGGLVRIAAISSPDGVS